MRPFVALTFVLGCAYAAPTELVGAVPAAVPAYGPEHYSAGAVVAHHPVAYAQPAAPAPYTTAHQAEGVTTVHQPAPIVTKQVHLGQTSYVSGYATRILKPATPHLPIAVPTVLRGSQTVNAPIVTVQKEIHQVQDPVFVNKPFDAPYDAPFHTQKIVEVPTPVHVDAPYNVPVPVAVQGETIVRRTQAAPVITQSHHVQAAPAALGYGYAAAPAVAHY